MKDQTTPRPFQVGDRVRFKDDPEIMGTVIWCLSSSCAVDFGLGECSCLVERLELIDRRREFLTRLQSLLQEFDAEIGDRGIYKIEGVEITFGNGEKIEYSHSTINHLNIMDYEKE